MREEASSSCDRPRLWPVASVSSGGLDPRSVLVSSILAGALVACSGGGSQVDAGAADAGPIACFGMHPHCPDGLRCAVGEVGEIALERGEQGVCTPPEELIGGGPAHFVPRPGGAPLAARLCVAQGLSMGGAGQDAVRARQVELLGATGVGLIRLDLPWDTIEPQRGSFDFSAIDPMIDAAVGAGVEVLGILDYGVPWASSATDSDPDYPPDDPADFARYVTQVVQHYAGRIHQYEIWNEPNGGYRFWKPTTNGDAAAFAALQAQAASAIRAACSDCVIHGAGLFYEEQLANGAVEFTDDMLTADPHALDGIDVFSLHPYTIYPPQDPPEGGGPSRSFAGMDGDLRAVLALFHVSLPLAATELGWPVYGMVDEAAQARLLSRAMLLGAALGWNPMCWFDVTDGPNHGQFPPEDDFGLYRYGSEDPSMPIDPKPARDAFAWLASVGQGAVFSGPRGDPMLHDPASGRYALDFGGPGGTWTAIWSLQPRQVSIDEPHTVKDHLGAAAGTTPGTLGVGPAPLFLLP